MAARAEGGIAAAPARRATPRRAPKRKAAAPATLSPTCADDDVVETSKVDLIKVAPSPGVVTRRGASRRGPTPLPSPLQILSARENSRSGAARAERWG